MFIPRNLLRTRKAFKFLHVVTLVTFFYVWFNFNVPKARQVQLKNVLMNRDKIYPSALNIAKKDWHDWAFIEYEKTRKGPGEQGMPYELSDEADIKLNKELFKVEGLYALVSDKISVNRSNPDSRDPKCLRIQYLKNLPSTSIIVIYHNEYPSILKRTIHAIYNRTPHELLLEILMVNDGSTRKDLYEPLQKYVKENFDRRVKIVNLAKRSGLIVARMEGVRRAKGEVLLFLDAHMEVNVNWLPPLLEPIALHPKTSTVPIIETFTPDTFEYIGYGNGFRGVFDWDFIYRWLPLRPEDMVEPERPTAYPVMLGGVFAIRKDYFLDLGGYDEQLMIWNGENYELSFKLWLCGGQLLQVPCSKVSHVFREHNEYRKKEGVDFVAYNFKRIAEVWLDDYKECLYRRDPERYASVDPGDLETSKLIRKNLNCKPFKHFLDFVMPDMVEKFPCVEPGVFASGAIQSKAYPTLCAETLSDDFPSLAECSTNLTHPSVSQNFVLTWHREIRSENLVDCCMEPNASFDWCTFDFGPQLWFYNLTTHQIVNLKQDNCLTANPPETSLSMEKCSFDDINQKWLWGFTNTSALRNWKTFGVKITGELVTQTFFEISFY